MPAATLLRAQIEASLAGRIPSALTPVPRTIRPVLPTGVGCVDTLLHGGLPVGAITEIVGADSSGRTSLALSFLAQCTQASRVCAWVDVSDALHPESAAASGVDLARLLWIRCGAVTNTILPRGGKPWSRIDQALRVTDLLLQAGGFGAVVLDMGSVAPEFASRVPMATWFRYRAAAERSQASLLLLTQHACAKSSAGLLLHLQPGAALCDGATVFTGLTYRLAVARERFKPASSNVIPLRRPSQRTDEIGWQSHTPWSGGRRSGTETETGHR